MTEFVSKIVEYLSDKSSVSTWEIAQDVFPERWRQPAARGAMIGHIRRAAEACDELGYIPGKDQWDSGYVYLR